LLLGAGGALGLIATAQAGGRHHKHAADPAAAQTAAAGDGTPATTPIGPFDTVARWAFIVDTGTGTVLFSKNADEEMPPSSLTKLMTAYLVFSALKAGRLSLDQALPVSERAWRMQGSKMFVPLGQQVKVEDLIRGMIIQSGNDACIVLAEGIAGSEEQFVTRMNEAAAKLGMTHTQFRNATGWPDPDHHMSVRDIATLATALIRDFPQYYHFFGETNYKFGNIDQGNRNVLVDKGLADGLKTGHTDAGGFGLCASASRDGRRIVMVLNGMPSSKVRGQEGERLLEWAFNNFEDVKLFAADQPVESAPVWLGETPTVALVSPTDVVVTMPHGWRNTAHISVSYDAPINAPIHKNQPLGTLTVSIAGAPSSTISLVAARDVGRMMLPLRSLAILEHAVLGS
jgi:D-alanyl-D-alanine carboxypeptidase (penicillin-binding protein 5/6)